MNKKFFFLTIILFQFFVTLNLSEAKNIPVIYSSFDNGIVAPPSNLLAKAKAATQITICWKESSDNETGFIVEQKTGSCESSNPWEQIVDLPSNSLRYTVSGLSPNTTYSFRAYAYNASANSDYSNCASASTAVLGTPPAPTNLKAESESSDDIKLSWTAIATNEDGFEIWRKAGSDSWGRLATTGPDITTYKDDTAYGNISSTSYRYFVLAYNSSGDSPMTYPVIVPFQPKDLSVSIITKSGKVKIMWTETASEKNGFEVWRKSGLCSSSETWTLAGKVAGNREFCYDAGVTSGNTYSYKVRGYKRTGNMLAAYGYSGWSDCESFSPDDDDGDGYSDNEQLTDVLTQYTNPDDRLMLTADTESGEKIAYYGTKNASGEPLTLDAVSYQTSGQVNTGTSTWLRFNNGGELSRIEGADGTVISVDKVNESEYALSAISGDGQTQVNTVIELDDTETYNQGAEYSQSISFSENKLLSENDDIFAQNLVAASGSDNRAYVHASVFECGSYEGVTGAEVYFTAGKPGDASIATFLAEEKGNGRYRASIPLGNAPLTAEAVTNACKELATVLSVTCDTTRRVREAGTPVFCAALAASLDFLAGGPTGEAVLIYPECEAGFIALEAYCSASGGTPSGVTGTGLPGPTDKLCDNIGSFVTGHPGVQAAIDMNQLEVQAYAKLPGRGTKTSDPVTINPFTEEFPTFMIDFGGDIAINEISVSPAVPRKNESYSVTTKLSCSKDSAVTIEVTHTDGTTIRREFSPISDDPITIQVPGSSSNRDVIRVLAVSPKIGPMGFIKAFRDVVVEFQDRSDESPVNEAFEADADIPGVNVAFRPTSQAAIKSIWVTKQEAISLIASEGSTQNSEYISITINPNVVNGTDTKRFSSDITATAALFLFSSPLLKHANVGPYAGTNVQFTSNNGFLEITSWGTNFGDIISGSFAVQVSGVQITGTDSTGNYTFRTHTGAIIGSFNLEIIPTDTN